MPRRVTVARRPDPGVEPITDETAPVAQIKETVFEKRLLLVQQVEGRADPGVAGDLRRTRAR
jgi:hypothetical protein